MLAGHDGGPRKRIKLFRQGELGRMIGGHGESARRALSGRVRGNLAYLARNGKVTKDVDENGVVWNLG